VGESLANYSKFGGQIISSGKKQDYLKMTNKQVLQPTFEDNHIF